MKNEIWVLNLRGRTMRSSCSSLSLWLFRPCSWMELRLSTVLCRLWSRSKNETVNFLTTYVEVSCVRYLSFESCRLNPWPNTSNYIALKLRPYYARTKLLDAVLPDVHAPVSPPLESACLHIWQKSLDHSRHLALWNRTIFHYSWYFWPLRLKFWPCPLVGIGFYSVL